MQDSYARSGAPETDLYYSTSKQSESLGDNVHEQAMSVVRHKKHSVTKMTSPRHMLLTQAGKSNQTDSSARNGQFTSSYDRSSALTRSRGRRPFTSTSYHNSFPIRCISTDKTSNHVRHDVENRQMMVGELSSSKANNDKILIEDLRSS